MCPVVAIASSTKETWQHSYKFVIRRVILSTAAKERLEAQYGSHASVNVGR